ncbi:MAG: hypothetical protein AABZ39_13085 [Spirochaetota bacterium]
MNIRTCAAIFAAGMLCAAEGSFVVLFNHPSAVTTGVSEDVAAKFTANAGPETNHGQNSVLNPWIRTNTVSLIPVKLATIAEQVLQTDMLGRNERSLRAENGFVTLAVGDEPVYVIERK